MIYLEKGIYCVDLLDKGIKNNLNINNIIKSFFCGISSYKEETIKCK